MSVKVKVFLFISFLFVTLVCFNTQTSNALRKENNSSNAKAQASPTPKPKSNKPRKEKNRRKQPQFACQLPPSLNLTLSSSTLYLPCDGNDSSDCPSSDDYILGVSANASDPYGDTLTYTYNVNGGKITGEGGNVQWDLSNVLEGKYGITVQVDNGNGMVTTQSKEIEVVNCKCKPAQTSLDSVDDSDNTNTETTFNSIPQTVNANNPHGFMFSIALGRPNSRGYIEMPPNNPPTLQSWLSSSIIYLPCEVEGYPSNYKIDVFTIGNDIDGDTLLYTYDVSVGKIIGSGSNVQWDLSGVPSGKHKITAQVDDGKGAVTEQVLEIEVVRFGCNQMH